MNSTNCHEVVHQIEGVEMAELKFAFGKTRDPSFAAGGVQYEVVESRSASALDDADSALAPALDHPVKGPSLTVLATGKKTAAISACDITRPAPNSVTLPPLLRRLHNAGVPIDGVTILIATGLYRGATKEEIQSILGPEIAATYRVMNHDARAEEDHRWLGSTRKGTPVYIDKRFVDADLHN